MLFIGLFSCAALEEPPASLVVEAYIYENKPVENIKVSLIKQINSSMEEIAVTNAEVYIKSNNSRYKLIESAKLGYYELDFDLPIISGVTYELIVTYNDLEIVGETTIPKSITNLAANKDTIEVTLPTDFINVTWQNTPESWYLGVLSENQAGVTDFPFNNFFSIPTQKSLIKITPNDIQTLGKQEFILYGITKEYEDLYRISSSSIGSSNAGNMSNGFGIFAGFSSDTVTFFAMQK